MTLRIFIIFAALARLACAAPMLSIDFDCRTNNVGQTQPGFSSFLITSDVSASSPQTNATIRTFGTYRVTLNGNGGFNRSYTDRLRPLPTNQGAFTESQLLRDSVFSPDTTTNGGLNVLIENLPPTNRVQVTLWSFDDNSEPVRASDWYANSNLVRQAYQFTNSVLPVRNDQYRFSFTATTGVSGQLLIQGRRNPLSTNGRDVLPSVYLNALQIDSEPLEILSVTTNGNELRLTFVVRPLPGDLRVEETTGGAWVPTSGVIYSAPSSNRVTARFPKPNQARLYRVCYAY